MPNGANLHLVIMDMEFIFNMDHLSLSSLSGHFKFFCICITYEPCTMTFKAALSQTCNSYWKAIVLLVSRHNEKTCCE